MVRFGGEDNPVLARGLVDDDEGEARAEVVEGADAVGVYAVGVEACEEGLAVGVVADGAEHVDLCGGGA